jgi:hypothetical protein
VRSRRPGVPPMEDHALPGERQPQVIRVVLGGGRHHRMQRGVQKRGMEAEAGGVEVLGQGDVGEHALERGAVLVTAVGETVVEVFDR